MKNLLIILSLFLSLSLQAQQKLSTAKVWNFRTSTVAGRMPVNADFYGTTVYCDNKADSVLNIRVNGVIKTGFVFYPYSDSIVIPHKVTVTSNARYNAPYYQNSVKTIDSAGFIPTSAQFTAANTLIINWADSTAFQKVRGVVTKTWRIFPYDPAIDNCTYTYSAWSACNELGKQTRTVTNKAPSTCAGEPILEQNCTYTAPPCVYTYSAWSTCGTNNLQTRTVVSSSPEGCVGTPVLVQSCTYVPPTCTYTYSAWSECINNVRTRTVVSSSPSGCVGTPVLSEACVSAVLYGARNFYVSSSGSDSYTPEQAHSSATPWKTIAKINSYCANFLPGDSILFKEGDTFSGTLSLCTNGTATKPIIVSSYGAGAKPVITGFTTVSGWSLYSAGIYFKTITAASTPNVVTVNGKNTPLGRYPNNSFLTIDSHSGTTSITDAATNSATTNWTGATMVVRFAHWLLNKCPVTAHSGNTITYTNPIAYEPSNGWGFFFENDIKTLDTLHEWCYVGGKLYMYFGSANPDSYSVKVSTINRVVSLVSKNYITIHNLDLQGANVEAVYSTGTYNTVKDCNISFCGDNGITLWSNSNYNTVDNCNISQTQNRGIMGLATNATIKNCYIHAIALLPGMGNSINKAQTAISLQGTLVHNALIENNRIDSIGYQGILFSGNNSIVRYNHVSNFGYNLDDGAGIYTGGNNYTGRKIYNNIVINHFGTTASLGTNVSTVSLMGIYLDDNSRYVEAYNNTVADVQYGIFLHGSHETEVYKNTIYNTGNGIGYLSSASYDPMRNNNVRRNIFFAPLSTQYVTYHSTWTTDVNLFGAIDSNYYCRPLIETTIFKTVLSGSTSYKTFEQWKTYSSLDGNSMTSPFPATEFLFDYNSALVNKTVTGLSGWKTLGNVSVSGYTLTPFSSIILIK